LPNSRQVDKETYLELVLNHIEEAVQVVDSDGITIYYNQAASEMDGLAPSEVLGKHVLQVYPSLTLETSSIMQVLRTGSPVLNQQQTITTTTGKVITIDYSTYPLFRGGELVGACDISRDITKIKELSERVVDLHSELMDTKTTNRKKQKSSEPGCLARYTFNDIIGAHESMVRLKALGQRVAASSSPVLVIGETGTGKELLVQSIHNASPRKHGSFVAQNCAAFPATLLESILFGTVKGSFTGADDRPGLFELADGGTLFLDEINSMPMELQSKLLRVLQEGTLRRLGDTKLRPVDVRVVACTNVDPEEAVRNKELRLDLYYRLNVVTLTVPPLRQHKSDIPLLTRHFINMYNRKLSCHVSKVSEEVNQLFLSYSWPGNIRELQHAIEHAMNMVPGESIELEHLPGHLLQWLDLKAPGERADAAQDRSLPEILSNVEKKYLIEALEKCNGNISRAASQLGLPRQTLQYKLKMNGLLSKARS